MQTVCIDKGGLPFPQKKGFGIHMKNSFALYCIKELHFLMPVADVYKRQKKKNAF